MLACAYGCCVHCGQRVDLCCVWCVWLVVVIWRVTVGGVWFACLFVCFLFCVCVVFVCLVDVCVFDYMVP